MGLHDVKRQINIKNNAPKAFVFSWRYFLLRRCLYIKHFLYLCCINNNTIHKMKISATRVVFFICLSISVILMVAGFCVPPTGIIDGSVLTATGELFGFATLFQLPDMIHGRSVSLTHGSTSLSLGDNDEIDQDKQIEQGNEDTY